MESQKSSFRRYADVLEKLGLPVLLNFSSIYGEGKGTCRDRACNWSKREPKMDWHCSFCQTYRQDLSVEVQEQVVAHLRQICGEGFLFGGGKKEQEVFDTWIAKYPSIVSMIGKLNMCTELNLMSHLDVMLSMDSANMHLASLESYTCQSLFGGYSSICRVYGVETVTHQYGTAGFALPALFGLRQKPCWRRDYACLKNITPEQVIEKIEAIVG